MRAIAVVRLFCLVCVLALPAAADAGTTLACTYSGNVGSMYFANDGLKADYGCKARCEWITGSNRYIDELDNFSVGKGEKQTKSSKSYPQKILRSENAHLKCS